jgi:hypothetical protein
MKNLYMLFLICVIAVTVVSGQTRKRSGNQSSKSAANTVWSEVAVGKGGVKSLSLPAGLVEEKDNQDYDKIWKNASPKLNKNPSEVSISITIWDEGFKVPDLKPELATPENLLAIDLMNDLKDTANIKAKYYEVDGVNGELVQRKWLSDQGNQTMFVWGTYRYYMKTKAQRIMVTVIAPTANPQVAMKIIDSLKFEKSID